MATQRRDILPPSVPSGSSGDGESSPYAIDPSTGAANPSFKSPQPSAPISSGGADQNSQTGRGEALTRPYTDGIDAYGRPVPAAPGTADAPATAGFGQALGQREPLTLKPADDGVGFGKAIGG